jgi:hypothetical protein
MREHFLVLVFALVFPTLVAHAQESKGQEPKTKLEAFSARTGVVIVRGFEEIGDVYGLYSTQIEVDAKEFQNAATGKKQYGITIKVMSSGKYEKENTSYIDYDEIESLITGIDYIAKIDRSVTRFSEFQADFKTKDNLVISTFSSEQRTMASVSSGRIGKVQAFYKISSLGEIRAIIQKAKQRIDTLKKKDKSRKSGRIR